MKKRIFSLLLTLCLLFTAAASADSSRGFATPEECAEAVVNALVAGDMETLINCYAIPEFARGFSTEAYMEEYSVGIIGSMPVEPTNAFNVTYNEVFLTNHLLARYYRAASTFSDRFEDIQAVSSKFMNKRDHTMEDVLAFTDTTAVFSRLTYKGISDPLEGKEINLKRYMNAATRFISCYGALDYPWKEIMVELDFEGAAVCMPLQLVEYEGGWLISPETPGCMLYLSMPTQYALFPASMIEE